MQGPLTSACVLRPPHRPNSAPAGRTALHLACAKGATEVVELLLVAGADPGLRDALGNSPLLEAAKAGQDRCVDVLLKRGAPLGLGRTDTASLRCSCTADSDLPQLRWALGPGSAVVCSGFGPAASG